MCGLVGVMGSSEAAREAFLGLTTLQHRGQDAAGILTFDADGFHRVKNLGLVESVFTRQNIQSLTGKVAIGHARYSTVGTGDQSDVQPLMESYPFGIGMVHNGNIVNTKELGDDLMKRSRRRLFTRSDTEIILHLFADALSSLPSELSQFDAVCKATEVLFNRLNGSYSIVSLIAEWGLVAFRDPDGIRPLVLGQRPSKTGSGTEYIVASESVALLFLGYKPVRSLEPGEVLFIDMNSKLHSKVIKRRSWRPCMFEWVYFASPESVMDGVPVYGSRIQLGKMLAQPVREQIAAGKMKPDIIVPVPETSRIAAIALSEELDIPYREVLIKNRYIKRTFILDSQEKRQSAVSLKLSPVRSEIEGKRVLLVDDSIVRGTTSKKIVELVRAAGAAEVYFVSTCPPINNPCFYGIDFPDKSELIASGRDLELIRKELGADAVVYQSIGGLKAALSAAYEGTRRQEFNPCMACLTGEYPTGIDLSAPGFSEQRKKDRTQQKGAQE